MNTEFWRHPARQPGFRIREKAHRHVLVQILRQAKKALVLKFFPHYLILLDHFCLLPKFLGGFRPNPTTGPTPRGGGGGRRAPDSPWLLAKSDTIQILPWSIVRISTSNVFIFSFFLLQCSPSILNGKCHVLSSGRPARDASQSAAWIPDVQRYFKTQGRFQLSSIRSLAQPTFTRALSCQNYWKWSYKPIYRPARNMQKKLQRHFHLINIILPVK